MTRVNLRAFGIAAWSVFFIWLWASGEVVRYLGPRTYWVVPFGAITLGLATLAHVPLLRGSGARATARDARAIGIVVAPMLLLLAIPSPELGALAASRRSMTGPALAVPFDADGGPVSFAELQLGGRSPGYARRAGLVEGREVELTGFVTDVHSDGISLTRFYVACCAADAVPYTATILVSHFGGYPEGKWLRVRGRISTTADGYAVEAVSIEPVQQPSNPYL